MSDQWQPITPENLPKVGDEALQRVGERVSVRTVIPSMAAWKLKDWQLQGCTHFRPINPPQAGGAA